VSAIITITTSNLHANGPLEKDQHGYYKVNLGALNVFNSRGIYYDATEEVKKIFLASSEFTERVKRGQLKAENGHPIRENCETIENFKMRFTSIAEKRTCGIFKDISLLPTDKHEEGKPNIYIIQGWVKPHGELASVLDGAINNEFADAIFSGRYMFEQKIVNGEIVRYLRYIITFDLVYEPGIKYATKGHTMGSESSFNFFVDDLYVEKPNNVFLKEYLEWDVENSSGFDDNIKKIISKCSLSGCGKKHWTSEVL